MRARVGVLSGQAHIAACVHVGCTQVTLAAYVRESETGTYVHRVRRTATRASVQVDAHPCTHACANTHLIARLTCETELRDA
eukprot:5934913-Pleurochrysis_carterae.AAC.1